jgi:hypothetical protein
VGDIDDVEVAIAALKRKKLYETQKDKIAGALLSLPALCSVAFSRDKS